MTLSGFFSFVVMGLATWRLSSLLVRESGPFSLLSKMRHAIGVRYNQQSVPEGTNALAEAFTCVWCLSVWVGLGLWLLWAAFPSWVMWIAGPLGLSGVAVIVDEVTTVTEKVRG